MSAGVDNSYRMPQEAHRWLEQGVNIRTGYIETHKREVRHAMLDGLPFPCREVLYKGKRLDESDLNATLLIQPTWVVVDELAHSNVPGSKYAKRWQDSLEWPSNGPIR